MAFSNHNLEVFFDLVPTGAVLYAPVFDEHDEVVDFRFVRLNSAGQRLLGLPAQPSRTFREYFPDSVPTGVFAWHRAAYLTDEAAPFDFPYAGDGLDTYFRLVARRSDELLAVNFTDMADLPHSGAEQALRESQAREQAARAVAEQQRQRFQEVLMQLPAYVAVYHGPDHIYQFVNPAYQGLFPHRSFAGRPFREGTPESSDLGVVALFDQVYQTGEPYYVREMEGWFDFKGTSEPEQVFLNLSLHPLRNAQGHIDGVLDFSYDVTAQVRARQQVEQLNQDLAALNEELRASNEEYQLANTALSEMQQQLQQLTETTQAARATAEAERQRLHQVLMCMPANIALLRGPAHIYDLVNPEYERLFPARIPLGRPLREVIPELEGQGFYELLDRVYETGEPFYEDETQAWADFAGTGTPQRRYYRTAFEPIRNAQGEVTEVLNFAVDVTAQVEARHQVEQLNQQLENRVQQRTQQLEAARAATERQRRQWHELFMQAPVGICIFDGPEWVYEFINPGYQALFPGRALLGKRLIDALPEVADQPLMEILHRVYDTGEPFEAREVLVPLARTEAGPVENIYFDLVYQARRNETGQIDGFITYATDVTAQVGARQERERQRQQLHRLFLEAPAAICILAGPDLVYELVNASYQQLFPGRALQHRPLLEALPELTGQPVWQSLRQVYQTGQPHQELGMRIPVARHPGGPLEDFYFDYVQQPRYDAQGQVDGVVVFAFDITNQVHARQQVQDLNEELAAINEELQVSNEELNETNRQLTRTNVDLDTFVYTASHDLKAPITNIESIVLALRDTLPAEVQQDELVAHLLDLLDQTVGRFQVTIGQLTDVSRLQLAHAGPAEPVNLATVVQDVRLDLLPAIAAAGTQLAVEVAPALVVSFSPANLRSIIYNLLSNAIKYRAPDRASRVQVRAAQTPQAVVLTVQDNGLGMSELQQRQLFGLFQRLHTHVEGTGVGLYITKRLVENAGGTITVQSQPDAGTTFTVSLPS